MTQRYNNPMMLSYYKGKDWHSYTSFDYYNTKQLEISKNLYLVNCIFLQKCKIKENDIIKVLNGSVDIDSSKRIDQDNLPYIYNNHKEYKYDIYTGSDGKIDIYMKNMLNMLHINDRNDINDIDRYGICEGKCLYNTFLHYRT
jgi:hypothetical protein